ncbi:TlpA family protein disulfide reductase [Jeotgalibacillus soli]|uniref:Thioredoxin domain-containing protein n=1 Tax=Jeotgalibacillus soli TaxID=889306 RepID=A0A0C2VM24_9BACL|nr:TlpA disulfide reductase family protein [Jeotgalibacillus soli]KIL49962.1 hypothetical protein KP78_14300 [Jeotgalibacillus soli]
MKKIAWLLHSGIWTLIMGGFGFYLLLTGVGTFDEPIIEKEAPVNTAPVVNEALQRVPDFSLKALDGTTIQISDLKGKKVIVNFWTTWCPPCREEMPALQSYYEEYRDVHQVEIVAVNLTKEDHGKDKIEQFAREYGLTFPVVLDEEGKAQKQYMIMTLPTTFIVNEQGQIQKKIIGPVTREMLTEEIGN